MRTIGVPCICQSCGDKDGMWGTGERYKSWVGDLVEMEETDRRQPNKPCLHLLSRSTSITQIADVSPCPPPSRIRRPFSTSQRPSSAASSSPTGPSYCSLCPCGGIQPVFSVSPSQKHGLTPTRRGTSTSPSIYVSRMLRLDPVYNTCSTQKLEMAQDIGGA